MAWFKVFGGEHLVAFERNGWPLVHTKTMEARVFVLPTRHHGELIDEAGRARPWIRKDGFDWRFLDMATTNGHTTAVSDLVGSLRWAHQLCDKTGDNLSELLREALGTTGHRVGRY